MAASNPIGNVSKIYIQSQDAIANKYETLINTKLHRNPEATYQNVDTFSRAIMSLTTNTYQDTLLVTDISVAEEMAG